MTSSALTEEINLSFIQRRKTVDSIINEEYTNIYSFASLIAHSKNLSKALEKGNMGSVANELNEIKNVFERTPDIVFVSDFSRESFIDAGAPVFTSSGLFNQITNATSGLLNHGEIKEYELAGKKTMILATALEIVNKDSGRVTGYIYTGTILDNNYSLLRNIREKTSSDIVTITNSERLIATTDKRDSDLTITVAGSADTEHPEDLSVITIEQTEYISSSGYLQFKEGTSLLITIGIKSTPLENLKSDYLEKAIIIILLSLGFLSVSIILLNRLTSIPLKRLVEYSDDVESGETLADYKKGYIREYNRVGFRMKSMVNTIKSTEEVIKQFANATWEAIVIQKDGIILEANDQFYSMFGYDKKTDSPLIIGSNTLNLVDERSVELVKEHNKRNLSDSYEIMAKRKDRSIFPIEIGIRYMEYKNQEVRVAAIRDISERKKIAELMIQTEKMMSVGGLAAGMAHEINNPLAGLLQTISVIANRLGGDMQIPANQRAAEEAGTSLDIIRNYITARGIPEMVDSINEMGCRIADIVGNMLSFARKSDVITSSHHLSELLDRTLDLASTDFDLGNHYDFRQIEIIREYEENLPSIPCERAKIQQVILNILSNGAEAMKEGKTENPRFILRTRLESAPNRVYMEIEDNGPGMENEIRKRIFEPFFTTKPVGVGTGLGLSISYFIIKENHGGEMRVETIPGRSTNFIISLPLEEKNR